jgi:filamentous hemagglutinin
MWWSPRLGEPLPRGAEAVGVHHKLETYSLVPDHPKGGHKAYVFERALGITPEAVDHLAAEIMRGLATQPVTRVWMTPHGLNCQILVPARGVGIHHERVVTVTTGWELRYVGDRPRLVSAYIKKRG